MQALPLPDVAKYRPQAVEALADFRKAWEGLCEGRSLLQITAPVGLLLFDIAERLDLSIQERYDFLGRSLIEEIEAFMTEQETFLDE